MTLAFVMVRSIPWRSSLGLSGQPVFAAAVTGQMQRLDAPPQPAKKHSRVIIGEV
jgi:hypothetical protein